MSNTVINELDKILAEFDREPLYFEIHHHEPLFRQAFEMGKALGLFAKSDLNISLEELGYTVVAAGGYEKWRKEKERRENEAHQAVIDGAKATKDSAQFAKSSAKAAWLSGVVGAVAILISLYQLYKGNEIEDKLNAVTKRVESTDSLLKILRQSHTTNGPTSYRISSDTTVRQAVPVSNLPTTGSASQR